MQTQFLPRREQLLDAVCRQVIEFFGSKLWFLSDWNRFYAFKFVDRGRFERRSDEMLTRCVHQASHLLFIFWLAKFCYLQ